MMWMRVDVDVDGVDVDVDGVDVDVDVDVDESCGGIDETFLAQFFLITWRICRHICSCVDIMTDD